MLVKRFYGRFGEGRREKDVACPSEIVLFGRWRKTNDKREIHRGKGREFTCVRSNGHGIVGQDAVDGAQDARGYKFADVDRKGEEARPDCFEKEQFL